MWSKVTNPCTTLSKDSLLSQPGRRETRSCVHLPFCVCFIRELLILNGHAAYILQTLCERREIIKVVHDICSALVCIHAANIVHGDLNGMKYLKSQSTIRACQQALLIGVVYFERTGGCDSKVGADGVGSRHSSPTGLQQTLVMCLLAVNNILVQRNRGQEVTSAKIVDFNAAIRLNDAASTLSWVGAESISPPEVFEVLKSGLITLSLPVHSACQVCGC